MKIRKGFVSNSSSSSYICDVCGNIESGWDLSLSDSGMVECNGCGNTYCKSHMVALSEDETMEAYKEYAKEHFEEQIKTYQEHIDNANAKGEEPRGYWQSYVDEAEDGLEELNNLLVDANADDVREFLEEAFEDLSCAYPKQFCPICAMQTIKHSDIVKYMSKKFNVTTEDMAIEIKSKFSNRDAFFDYLNEK